MCMFLLQEMGGRLWRNREASCLAMTDLIQVNSTSPGESDLTSLLPLEALFLMQLTASGSGMTLRS